MPSRRVPARSESDPTPHRVHIFSPAVRGNPPTQKFVRRAKLASLPIAFAGRQVAGLGKRAMGRTAAEVNLDIQAKTAQHMFEVLGELKGCATKLGQLLAVFELALPPRIAEPYRIALSQLQNSTPAMLPPTVHAAMAASMGESWREQFLEFDDRRAAAASIGQVHRAVWSDGRQVAVKIMYPGARDAVLGDLEQLRNTAVLATVFAPGADVMALTDALCSCIEEELDYAREAEYQQKFAENYAGDPDFVVPQVIAQQGDVLVSDWLDGIPLPSIVALGTQAERNRAGILLLRFTLTSWDKCGLLYADPHPGNFQIMADGRLGVVDFGACAPRPPTEILNVLVDATEAILNGEISELDTALRKHGFAEPNRNCDFAAVADNIRPFLQPLLQPHYRATTGWLRSRILPILEPRLTNPHRQLTIPVWSMPFFRSYVTALAVLCQLETEGPIRDEFIRWSPEIGEALERFNQRGGNPPELDIA
ncbi:ABC1 kinase family protein [Mycobacteroides chelonae]|uniref:ABC1 kinase family protein n=1 Tax=Mycobacteroides chelonae TaxID=1774 RepID=UPI001E31C053|nr:AarF/ABC1/UbiB kinase family protein [Mycobacteroides chelonae]